MKLALAFPPPSPDHSAINIGHEPINNAPQTAHAVLAAYIRTKIDNIDITSITDQTVSESRNFEYRDVSQTANLCADSDYLGITCWFHNQQTALDLARKVKDLNNRVQVILGGPNVSSKRMAQLILEQVPEVDYVVRRDGEEALSQIVSGRPPAQIPNVSFRQGNHVRANALESIDMNNIPLWDYRDTLEWQQLLEVYDARTEAYAKAQKAFRGLIPRIGISTLRGCIKAIMGVCGGQAGLCSYCTTGETKLRTVDPANFWRQIGHLYQTHGIRDLLIADDVFPISAEYVESFHRSKIDHQNELPELLQFRGYAYPTTFRCPHASQIAQQLKEIGMENLFFGIETFDRNVSQRSNKDYFTEEDAQTTLELMRTHYIDSTIAIMLGLPGETRLSLQNNVDILSRLLERYGSKEFGQGNITRVDVSPAVPLVGTGWYNRLVRNEKICEAYKLETRRDLPGDITPDFDTLRDISLQFETEVSPGDVHNAEEAIMELCRAHLKSTMIGGFDLKKR